MFDRDIDLVLQYAGRPKHAHDIGVGVLAQPGKNLGRSLAQVTGATYSFKLLPQAVGKYLDLGSQSSLVVGQTLEVDAQRMVLVAALVVQYDRIAANCVTTRVGGEIVVEIGGDQRARVVQLQLVETERRANVFESLRALVAENPDFSSLRSLDHRRQVDPSIVVEVDSGDAPSFRRVGDGQWHALEVLAIDIAPQANAGCTGVGKGNVHPTIFVEVEDVHARGRRESRRVVQRHRLERAFALIQVHRRGAAGASHHQIDRAIVVDVRQHHAGGRSFGCESGFFCPVGECAVAVVAPQHVVGRVHRRRSDVSP